MSTNESILWLYMLATSKVPMSQKDSMLGCAERAVSVLYMEYDKLSESGVAMWDR